MSNSDRNRPISFEEASSKDNPRVFMDISVDDVPAGRLQIELFANVVPKTAENFRALCTGEKNDKNTGKPLHYKGSVFHLIRKGFLVEGGDISEDQNGRGEESIYGGYFDDENYKLRHTEPGILSVADAGPGTCGSMFFITLRRHPFLDGAHVVFGKVIKGIGALYNIDEVGTPEGEPTGVARRQTVVKLLNKEATREKGLLMCKKTNSVTVMKVRNKASARHQKSQQTVRLIKAKKKKSLEVKQVSTESKKHTSSEGLP